MNDDKPAPLPRGDRDRLTIEIISAKTLLGSRANGGRLFRDLQAAIGAPREAYSISQLSDDELQRAAKVAELIAAGHAAGAASVRKAKPEVPPEPMRSTLMKDHVEREMLDGLVAAPPTSPPTDDVMSGQQGGTHYQQFYIQPAEIAARNGLTFLEGSAVKRLHRHSRGGKGIEDLRKAIHEIRLEAKFTYNEDI